VEVAAEFAIQTSGVYEDVPAAAWFSEERGLPTIALPDHYLMALDEVKAKTTPASDALIQLAGLACDADRIGLVVPVSPITFRHPAVLVKSVFTIDRMPAVVSRWASAPGGLIESVRSSASRIHPWPTDSPCRRKPSPHTSRNAKRQ